MSKQTKIILLAIFVLAAVLRLYRFDLADVINDEVFYGFRAIGLIDFLNSPFQSTTWEWFEEVPAWAKLSFHDHPPLGFWIQNLFLRIFGTGLLALRLPFILAGVVSVYLVYLIARRLFGSDNIALLAAAVMAVNSNAVWVSRIGLQEGLVIFFILLAFWLFLKEQWWSTVIVTGLAILMKYTAVILLPIFLSYLVWKRRDLLTPKRMIVSAILLILILSPVIIYNLKLQETRGHFDFQLSYALGQEVPEWKVRPGRDVGGLAERAQNLLVNFSQNYGIAFSVLTLFAVVFVSLRVRQRRTKQSQTKFGIASPSDHGRSPRNDAAGYQFLGLSLGFLLLLFLLIGPQERFLAMLAPFFAILIAAAVITTLPKTSYQLPVISFLLIAELAFTINSFHLITPKGQEGVHYSYLRRDANTWGYNELEDHLSAEMTGFYAQETFPLRFDFVQKLQQRAIQKAREQRLEPRPVLFVTDSRMHGLSSLWYITRHSIYDGWPMITDKTYLSATANNSEFFAEQGFEEVIFIKAQDTLLRSEETGQSSQALEEQLIEQGFTAHPIISPAGRTAFLIYKLKNLTF